MYFAVLTLIANPFPISNPVDVGAPKSNAACAELVSNLKYSSLPEPHPLVVSRTIQFSVILTGRIIKNLESAGYSV